MGSILVALDTQLRRRVALKLIRQDRADAAHERARFEQEARAVAQLQHPNVVQIYDYGVDDDGPYLVMELLSGEDLAARLLREGRLPVPAAVAILVQAGRALGAAHAAGIIHRDLKPANIFLTRNDGREIVKLLDFGLALPVTHRSQELIAGTPEYMSPEQVRAEPLDPRSDLFALGAVAYQVLTGRRPFAAPTLAALLHQIQDEDYVVPAPSSVLPGLCPAVDELCARALCRRPAGRFQSAHELCRALAAVEDAQAEGQPQAVKILVVDDEADVAALIRQRFRPKIRKGEYEFVFAADGLEALEQLRRRPDLDVILSDINMPRLDGLSLLPQVADINPVARVVIVSAYGDMHNLREAMNRGAFDFVLKPLDFQDLERTIDKALRGVRAARASLRAAEENQVLRTLLRSGAVERLVPSLRATEWAGGAQMEATVAVLRVPGAAAFAPGQRLQLLNRVYDVAVPELVAFQGVVSHFVGDAAVAYFQGPAHPQHALSACVAARARLHALGTLLPDGTPCPIAIGADSGAVYLGRVGSAQGGRMDFTLVGAPVDRALSLCGRAGPDQLLIPAALRSQLGDLFECRPEGDDALDVRALSEARLSEAPTRSLITEA